MVLLGSKSCKMVLLVVAIPLCNSSDCVFVSPEDFDFVNQFSWRKMTNGYISTIINKKLVYMHRAILERMLGSENILETDHIDRVKHNNCRWNLRQVTHSQNQMNRGKPSNNTSGVTGVIWFKKNQKWGSRIVVNYRTINLGFFKTFEEAVQARKEAEKKYFGEFAPI